MHASAGILFVIVHPSFTAPASTEMNASSLPVLTTQQSMCTQSEAECLRQGEPSSAYCLCSRLTLIGESYATLSMST